jgi:hypothetical protein
MSNVPQRSILETKRWIPNARDSTGVADARSVHPPYTSDDLDFVVVVQLGQCRPSFGVSRRPGAGASARATSS